MKKSFVLLLTLVMAFSMCILSGALELDTAENAADSVIAEDAALAEVTVAPGINVLTGDTTLATFDTLPEAIFGSNETITKYEVVDGETSKLLKWEIAAKTGTAYPQMYINIPAEIGRKYYYKFDTKMTGTNPSDKVCWLMYDSGNILAYAYDGIYQNDIPQGKWVTMEGTSGEATRATTQIGLQTKIMNTTAEDPCYYYYDNMALIPMYKITYTGVGVDHILFDEEGNVLTSFAPRMDMVPEWTANDGQLVKFLGWSELPEDTTAQETVELWNSDVTLYPVWEKRACLSSTWYMKGAAGTTLDITAAEEVEWSVDVGNSEATYAVSGNKLTITAAGYPGVVTVTATAADGSVATKVITVAGGDNYKPGLNMMTGTADVLDFDDKPTGALGGTPAQYNFSFSGVNGAAIVANPYTDYTGNDGGNMLEMTLNATTSTNTYPKFYLKTPTEEGRPYQLTMKIATAMTSQYLWLNGDANLSYGGNLNGTATSKTWYTINKKYTGKGDNLMWQYKAISTKVVNHVDDIAVYPYYKITYIGLDGNAAYTEYVLYNADGSFMTEYTPGLSNVPGANKLAFDAEGTEEITGSIPLNYEDITIYGIKTNDIIFIVDGEQKTVVATEDEYTIGTPADLGFEGVENFLAWVDQDGVRYYAGEVVATSDMTGKNFTAFCQDVTKPAMGFAYEGDTLSNNAAKYNYQEVMEDDGRSVLHAHQYGSTWNGSTAYATDPRIYLAFQPFDANEYNVVQYVVKMENGLRPASGYGATAPADMPAEGLGVQTGTQTIIFYYPENSGDSYYKNYGECRVGGAHNDVPMNGEYQTLEIDMSIEANGNTNGGQWKNRTIYGFAIDANKWATFGADVYVDYIRVYRDGVFSVTYDTNAPAGATVVSEVAADEGRGTGTGYLLKGEKPVVEGYTFVGWSTKKDATRADVVEAIDLTKDATVYAVWQKTADVKNPVYENLEFVTKGADLGIRFKTSLAAADKSVVDEIGFIGTLEKLLPVVESVPDYSALTFNFKKEGVKPAADAKLYVTGVAYNKAEGIDLIHDETDAGLVYSAFCKGMGTETIVVKPYVQLEINGNGVTFYGEAMVTSFSELGE